MSDDPLARQSSEEPAERVDCEFGDFHAERILGVGGMGVVYVGRHRESGQLVAIKVLKQSIVQQRTLTHRFRREFQAIAMLEHPHIVPLVASGIELETAFLAMRLIDGVTLTDVIASFARVMQESLGSAQDPDEIERSRTPITASSAEDCAALLISNGNYFTGIAELAAQVADALQAAHDVGIVHRDIKPSNILLDINGKAWLTDFGLASFSDDQTVLTMSGEIVGTPTYMSPEQAMGQDQRLDVRGDVYSLGATLFELATLHRPFKGSRDQILFRVTRGDVPAPRSLRREVPSELEVIILKAMALSPEARYRTASEMAQDLRRFTAGELVHAKRPGWVERAYKWAEKNPLVALASLLGLIATIIAVFAVQAVNSRSLRAMNRILENTNHFLSQSNAALGARERELQNQLYVSDISAAFEAYDERDVSRARQLLEPYGSRTDARDFRGMAWYLLDGLTQSPAVRELTKHTGPATELAVFPDHSQGVSVGHDGSARIFNLRSKAKVQVLKVGQRLDSVAVAPDGMSILTGLNIPQRTNTPRRYDVRSGELLAEWESHPSSIESAAISPDGSLYATACRYDEIRVHDVNGKIVQRIASGSRNEALAFVNDGQYLGTIMRNSDRIDSLQLHDLATGQSTKLPIEFDTKVFACSRPKPGDSSFLIVAGGEGSDKIDVVRWPSGESVLEKQQFAGRVRCVDISPGGELIAAGCDEGSVFVWNLAGRPNQPIPPPLSITASDQRITSVKFVTDPVPGGHPPATKPRGILTTCEDGYVRLWSLPQANPRALFDPALPGTHNLAMASWMAEADAEQLYLRFADNSFGLLDSTLKLRRIAAPPVDRFGTFCITPNGERAIVATPSELVSINLQSGLTMQRVAKHDVEQNCTSMLIVGAEMFALFNDHIMVMDAKTLRKKRIHQLPIDNASQLVRVPRTDAIRVVTRQRIHELKHGKLSSVAASSSSAENYDRIAFSQSGEHLAICYANGSVRIESPAGKQPPVLLHGHRRGILDCIFLDNDRTLATSSHDRTIRLWDLVTGRELGTLNLSVSSATSIQYLSKARVWVTTHEADPPHIWTLSPRDERRP